MVGNFPSPIEQNIYEIVQGTYLSKDKRQFLPLLNPALITNETIFPVITPVTVQRRRTEDGEYMFAEVMITIWDLLVHGEDLTIDQLQMMAVYKAQAYESDLISIIDILVNPEEGFRNCFYQFSGEQTFTGRYNEDVYSTLSEYHKASYKDRIIGSTVLFTLKGPTGCVACYNEFGNAMTKIFC